MTKQGKGGMTAEAKAERLKRQAAFASRLREWMEALDVTNAYVAKQMATHATSVARWRRLTYISGPPPWPVRRKIEEVLGLPQLYLDSQEPTKLSDLLATRAEAGPQTPVAASAGLPPEWVAAKAFVLGQLAGHRTRNTPIGAAQVGIWLEELERAVRAIGAAGAVAKSDAALTALEAEKGRAPRAPAKSGSRRPGRKTG